MTPLVVTLLLAAPIEQATTADVYAHSPSFAEEPGRMLKELKPKRKYCNTTQYSLQGDYAYEACGAFCKQAKATNHCKFCKCRACAFCKAAAAASGSSSAQKGASSVSSASTSAGSTMSPRKKKGGQGSKKRAGGSGSKKKAKKILKRKLRQTASSTSQ